MKALLCVLALSLGMTAAAFAACRRGPTPEQRQAAVDLAMAEREADAAQAAWQAYVAARDRGETPADDPQGDAAWARWLRAMRGRADARVRLGLLGICSQR